MLSQEDLPESCLCKCLDVLRVLSASERDFIRVVVEVVQDLRERDEDDDQPDEPNVRWQWNSSIFSPLCLQPQNL